MKSLGYADSCNRLVPVMSQLKIACERAKQSGTGVWEYAVELAELKGIGISNTDLRWLIATDAIIHANEISSEEDEERVFVPMKNLAFGERTCFILTKKGMDWLRSNKKVEQVVDVPTGFRQYRLNSMNSNGAFSNVQSQESHGMSGSVAPDWQSGKRVLTFGDKIVKKFKWPAPNQELLVAAFQEEGWPETILDPLPPDDFVDSKARLHDTIKCLNRNQANAVIRFHGNGDGQSVRWSRC